MNNYNILFWYTHTVQLTGAPKLDWEGSGQGNGNIWAKPGKTRVIRGKEMDGWMDGKKEIYEHLPLRNIKEVPSGLSVYAGVCLGMVVMKGGD